MGEEGGWLTPEQLGIHGLPGLWAAARACALATCAARPKGVAPCMGK